MGTPTDPPRSGIRTATRDVIAACTWSNGQLINASNLVMKAALSKVSSSGYGVTVEWRANVASQYGSAVAVTIPQATYDIIKNGSHDATSGHVTYNNKTYTFQQLMDGTVPSMVAVGV
jgi:hypothetical protein